MNSFINGRVVCYFLCNFLMILAYFVKASNMKATYYRPSLPTHCVNVILLAAGGTLFLVAMIFYIIYLEWARN